MSEAVATVGGDIVNGDVQHAHDGRAIDVLSTHPPACRFATGHAHLRREARPQGRPGSMAHERTATLRDPVVRARHRRHGDRVSTGTRTVPSSGCHPVSCPPQLSNHLQPGCRAAATGLPIPLRSREIHCAVGEANLPLTLPFPGQRPISTPSGPPTGPSRSQWRSSRVPRGLHQQRGGPSHGLGPVGRACPGLPRACPSSPSPQLIETAPPVAARRVRTTHGA